MATNTSATSAPNASAGAQTAQKGDTVQVDYVGTFQNGTVFDTSIKSVAQQAGLPLRPTYSPLEFTLGAGQMIPGFDAAVVGMTVGQTKTVTLTPDQAYGPYNPDAVVSIPLSSIGNSANVTVGSVLQAQSGATGTVVSIANGTAKVDFNSEMAGKTLVFTITLVKID